MYIYIYNPPLIYSSDWALTMRIAGAAFFVIDRPFVRSEKTDTPWGISVFRFEPYFR